MALIKKNTSTNRGYYSDGLNYRFNAPTNFPKCYNDSTLPTHRVTINNPVSSPTMFGVSVDAGEGHLVIGASQTSVSLGQNQTAYVYDLDGNQGYELLRTGTSSASSDIRFGSSVQIGYDRVFVAASDDG